MGGEIRLTLSNVDTVSSVSFRSHKGTAAPTILNKTNKRFYGVLKDFLGRIKASQRARYKMSIPLKGLKRGNYILELTLGHENWTEIVTVK